MPEGPEVRRYADSIATVLEGEAIESITARTKQAKAWLQANPDLLIGRRIESVKTIGKHLFAPIEGGYYFYSHLMMWGRWFVHEVSPEEIDRRERARIVTAKGTAILHSAPVFEIGTGDPMLHPQLSLLGTDVLALPFDAIEFQQRLLLHPNREIGAALLEQSIAAGIGNYLRAEILFLCKLDPWKLVGELTETELTDLSDKISSISQRAYATGGVTVTESDRAQMRENPALVYRSGSEWGDRHYVFRRTNLPCLICATPIRQKRQVTRQLEDEEKTRIIYFCPICQKVALAKLTGGTDLKPTRKRVGLKG